MCGDRPYDFYVDARENIILSVSAIGEGFHNFHHNFPQDYAASEWGWSFNMGTIFKEMPLSWLSLQFEDNFQIQNKLKKIKNRFKLAHT